MSTLPTAAVFIDGSNRYHAAKSTRGQAFNPEEYRQVIRQLSERFDLAEVRFYDAAKDKLREPQGYAKQQSFHAQLQKMNPRVVIRTRPLRYDTHLTPMQVEKAGEHAGIQEQCRKLLFAFLTRLGLNRSTREKGIDVLLAIDAVETARHKTADWIVFLTGDADFVPAVHLLHELNLKTLNLHTYRGSATELRNACTTHALLKLDTPAPHIYWYGQNTPNTLSAR